MYDGAEGKTANKLQHQLGDFLWHETLFSCLCICTLTMSLCKWQVGVKTSSFIQWNKVSSLSQKCWINPVQSENEVTIERVSVKMATNGRKAADKVSRIFLQRSLTRPPVKLYKWSFVTFKQQAFNGGLLPVGEYMSFSFWANVALQNDNSLWCQKLSSWVTVFKI